MNCRASDVVTSVVGPFSPGPIVTTALVAFPIAFAMASGSWKVDSTALRRLDSSVEITCKVYERACIGLVLDMIPKCTSLQVKTGWVGPT